MHRGKFVFRRKSEGRRIWTYDTCTSGPQVLLWKSGCADAYCAAGALVGESKDSVEQFMQLLQNNDEKAEKKWEEYLDYLAILISNLRMAYDMDIILGGEMGWISLRLYDTSWGKSNEV